MIVCLCQGKTPENKCRFGRKLGLLQFFRQIIFMSDVIANLFGQFFSNDLPISCHWSLSITPEFIKNLSYFDIFKGYRKKPVAWNGLNNNTIEYLCDIIKLIEWKIAGRKDSNYCIFTFNIFSCRFMFICCL